MSRRLSADFTPFADQSWEHRTSYDSTNIWAPVENTWTMSPRRHLYGDVYPMQIHNLQHPLQMVPNYQQQPQGFQQGGLQSLALSLPEGPNQVRGLQLMTGQLQLNLPSQIQNQNPPNLQTTQFQSPHNYQLQNHNVQPVAPSLTNHQSVPSVSSTHKGSHKDSDLMAKLAMVDDYFMVDHHQRVQVTVDLLNKRFFQEEQFLSDAYQLRKFPIEHNLRTQQLILVAFKAGRIDVFYLPSDVASINVGDIVIVEADRGHDLGKVVKKDISIDEARLLKLLQFQEQQSALSDHDMNSILVKNLHHHSPGQQQNQTPHTLHFPKPVIGLAQQSEILQILNKKQDEEKACRLCLAKIANTTAGHSSGLGNVNTSDLLQMALVDAEYQYDRKKLIFYYSTTKRIDFRDLVRELFRIYKTRIWMCAVIGHPYANQPTTKKSPLSTSPLMASASLFLAPRALNLHGQQAKERHNSWSYPTPEFPATISGFGQYNSQPSPQMNTHVPRRFPRQDHDSSKSNAESFVLKSLVDSINH